MEAISMFLDAWYFVTVTLTALLMGSTFCHVLEMPAKLKVEGALWMTLQQTLYRTFATVGGFIEIAAILAAIVLAFLMRENRPAFYLNLLAAISLAVAFFVVWIFFTNAVNVQVFKWTADNLPADWTRWRMQWEYSHAVRFILQLVSFSALLLSMLLRARPG
jgi:hypothetical protein